MMDNAQSFFYSPSLSLFCRCKLSLFDSQLDSKFQIEFLDHLSYVLEEQFTSFLLSIDFQDISLPFHPSIIIIVQKEKRMAEID